MKGGGGRAVVAIEQPASDASRSRPAFPPSALPCCQCGEPACYLQLPQLTTKERAIADVVLRVLSMKIGRRLEVPIDGNLAAIVDAAQLSELLQLMCWECAELAGLGVVVEGLEGLEGLEGGRDG